MSVSALLHFVFWGAFACSALFLATSRRCRSVLGSRWKTVSLIVFLALIWRLPFEGRFFYGLEYEDSYIYSVAGRYLSAGDYLCNPPNSCYLTTVCAVGNLNTCAKTETFSGHFIGYPFMIAAASRIFGYSPAVGSYVSLLASLLTVVFIFLVCEFIDPNSITGLAGATVFSVTPVFAVLGVGTYAEPVSDTLVIVSLLLGMHLLEPDPEESSLGIFVNWIALTFSALFAVLVKRENLLLIPILVLAGLWIHVRNRRLGSNGKWSRYAMLLISSLLCIVFAITKLYFMRVVQSETAEFGVFPFSWTFLRTMFPLFMKSYLSLSWYVGGGIFVLLGVVASIRSRKRGMFAAGLFAAFLLLYASHVRSYYQLKVGDVTQFDTLRYSMNLAGLWSIMAALGFSYFINVLADLRLPSMIAKHSKAILWFCVVAYVLTSWVLGDRLKEDMVAQEYAVRIEPAQSALEFISAREAPNTFVITLEPLIIQMLARDPVNVIDFDDVNAGLVNDLSRQYPNMRLLYIEEATYLSDANRERYRQAFDFLDSVGKNLLYKGDNFAVYLLTVPPHATTPRLSSHTVRKRSECALVNLAQWTDVCAMFFRSGLKKTSAQLTNPTILAWF
jgi:uncharacterized membrane protein